MTQRIISIVCALLFCGCANAADRAVVDLSGPGWSLWLDKAAAWQDDTIHAPPVDLAKVPANPPTVGWAKLYSQQATPVSVPGTVEEYLWGVAVGKRPHGVEGNYQGVSFWWKSFDIPADWQGKRILLRFGSCHLRSEVFVNNQLVGYDCVGNSPFEIDLTGKVTLGAKNRLAVRITDPNPSNSAGHFDWQDFRTFRWGRTQQRVPMAHGFGGITGGVSLVAVDPVYIDSVFVKNKPQPSAEKPTSVDVDVEVSNQSGKDATADVTIRILSKANPADVVFKQAWSGVQIPAGGKTLSFPVDAPQAKIWDLVTPNLYTCEVTLKAGQLADMTRETFGFRWFSPEMAKDPVFRLNGRRMMLRSAISWGFFPINGTWVSEEMATRQIAIAQKLGLNMLNAHRTIVQPILLEKADEMGLLYYCEPGGFKASGSDDGGREMAREKLLRMVKRDRNHPSLVIYNMINELFHDKMEVQDRWAKDMEDAHAIDPTRTIVLASGTGWGTKGLGKSWMMPYEDKRREEGWTDNHNAGGPQVYHDELYQAPNKSYLHNDSNEKNLNFWGEEGAIASPPQLDSLVADYKRWGRMGWDGDEWVNLHEAYTQWLKERNGFKSFPTINDWARSLGNIPYYYQARVIETCRAKNKIDGYVINGWEGEKMENTSGVVDVGRHAKGDPVILAYYNQPLYIAVKPRAKIASPGTQVIVDFYIINEKNVNGSHKLIVKAADETGRELLNKSFDVKVQGGERFGQLLVENVELPVGDRHGYVKISAELLGSGDVSVTSGRDELFVCEYKSIKLPANGAVIDAQGPAASFLKNEMSYDVKLVGDVAAPSFIVADGDPANAGDLAAILAKVQAGARLVVIGETEKWADALNKAKFIECDGKLKLAGGWDGGSYFVLQSPLFDGLPQNTAMNWEYQTLQRYGRELGGKTKSVTQYGLLLKGETAAAGAWQARDPRLATSVGTVACGRGVILLSTPPVWLQLTNEKPQANVPKRLFLNYLTQPVK